MLGSSTIDGLSAAERRELRRQAQDEEIRPFLAATFGDQPWTKPDATAAFIAHKGFLWGGPWGHDAVREIMRSVERVIREVVDDGFPRYWWSGHRGAYVTLAGLSDEDLVALSHRWGEMSKAFARLRGRHDRALVKRGVEVDPAELDEMIAELQGMRAAL